MTKGRATRTRHIQRARKYRKLPRGKNHPRTHICVYIRHTCTPMQVCINLYTCVQVCV